MHHRLTTPGDPEGMLRLAAEELGLEWVEQPLRSQPSARHIHVRHPRQKGTLELTWWPNGELVIEVRANRQGPWTVAAANHLLAALNSAED